MTVRGARSTWIVIAILVGLIMGWAALSHHIYHLTTPNGLAARVFGKDVASVHHPAWLSLHVALRKLYSIVAFTLVGFVVDKALPPVRRRALRSALLVGAFSLLVEIAQRLHHSHESTASQIFDVGCGLLGGWCAIALQPARSAAARPRRSRADRVRRP